MAKKTNTRKLKRNDVYKGEKLISRHYFITDEIHIELIKLATENNMNISAIVRVALKQYINNSNLD